MKNFRGLFALFTSVLLVLLSISGVVSALENKVITVLIKDENGNGVPAINVTLIGSDGYSSTVSSSKTNGSAVFDDIEENGEYTATVTIPSSSSWIMKPGEGTSKSVEITDTNDSETIIFRLVKKETAEEVNYKILDVTMPSSFTKVGSTSTILRNIKISEVPAVKNFTLDDPTANKIVFLQEVNLSDNSFAEKFAQLDRYVSISETGRVILDSDALPELNKKAKITMRGMNLVSGSNPTIVEDGSVTTKVTNIMYSNQILTFDVAGFSNYAFKPTLKIEAPESTMEPTFTIQGEVDDLDSLIDIYLGEERILEELEPEDDGTFVFSYNLEEEENSFRIIASSKNGETAEVEFETIFKGGSLAEESEESSTISTLAIILIAGSVIIVVFGVYYLIKKSKKKKVEISAGVGEVVRDSINPEITDVASNETTVGNSENTRIDSYGKVHRVAEEDRIGKTDLEPIDPNSKND
ncbi:Ig-like domain-containing protein [Candidatus Dojkabacteria bacterium]|nr:Ig-like domain-containing protein [Candidatus Dojkabacteria bacterium]